MITKKDLKEEISSLRKEIKKDLEDAVAQVIEFVLKYSASKDDLKELAIATKEEFKEVKEEILEVKSDVKDIKRQINDLKADVPSPQEFADHEKRIAKLEVAAFPQ